MRTDMPPRFSVSESQLFWKCKPFLLQLVRAEYIYDAVSIYARALDWILRSQHIESEDQIARLAANGTALFTAITSMQNFTCNLSAYSCCEF